MSKPMEKEPPSSATELNGPAAAPLATNSRFHEYWTRPLVVGLIGAILLGLTPPAIAMASDLLGYCNDSNYKQVAKGEAALTADKLDVAKGIAREQIADSRNCGCALTLMAAMYARQLEVKRDTATPEELEAIRRDCYEFGQRARQNGGYHVRLDGILATCSVSEST